MNSSENALARKSSDTLIKYDKLAEEAKDVFEPIWYTGIFSGVLAAIVFAVLVVYKERLGHAMGGIVLPVLEFVLIALSVVLLSNIAPKKKKKFIDLRRTAEVLRIEDLLIRYSVPITRNLQPLERYSLPTDVDDLLESTKTSLIWKTDSEYQRILDGFIEFIEGQSKYHVDKRIKKFEKWEHRLESSLKGILILFLLAIGVKFIIELLEYFKHGHLWGIDWHKVLYISKFSVIILPPLYAALEGLYFFSDWKRSIRESESTKEKYDRLKKKIAIEKESIQKVNQDNSKENILQLANELFDLFHQENLNWYNWYASKKIEARV